METTDSMPPDNAPSGVESGKYRSRIWRFIRKFCLDMLPVIAGVVIGMFLNNEREARQNRNLTETTLQALSGEFKENGREIDTKLTRHTRIIDSLQYYMADEQLNLFEILVKGGGLASSEIYTTNWRATLNNNSLRLINFQTVKLLSRIENLHEDLAKQVDMLFLILYEPSMYKRGKDAVVHRKNVFDLMVGYRANEQELLQLYAEFENVVNTKQY
jgi:hypothetical protein